MSHMSEIKWHLTYFIFYFFFTSTSCYTRTFNVDTEIECVKRERDLSGLV